MGGPLAAVAVAGVAFPIGKLVPLLGGPIVALIIGMLVATVAPAERLRPGLAFTSRYVLQVAIVLLGATISLGEVARVGASSLPVMLGSLAAALLAAALLGRLLAVPDRLRVLIGVGTGICGASAIAAVSGVVDAKAREVRYAISTIFVFNLVAVLVFPPVGRLLGLDQHAFGLWAGTAVNDASSVVAAGFAYGHEAGTYAVVVKLTRTTMIIPIAVGLAVLQLRRARHADSGTAPSGSARRRWTTIVPWFLLWFAAASAADSAGLFDVGARAALSQAGLALTTVALAAVGLSSDFGEARRTGLRPLALGALVWLVVTAVSLGLQQVAGGV